MAIIAFISDTHDQINYLKAAVNYANKAQADLLIHCGDLISAFMLHHLAAFLGPVHLIYGNNIGDTHIIIPRCYKQFPEITHHGVYGSIVEDDISIGIVHYPDHARKLARTGIYDIVGCGHTHEYMVERIETTLIINPGSMLGEHHNCGFVLLDTKTMTLQRIGINDCMFDRIVPLQAQKECSLKDGEDIIPKISDHTKK